MRAKMREQFKKIKYMSATTDVWSRCNRSYIAVTVHYFEDKFQMQSKFIACERFIGNHTNEKVASKLKSILERFGILNKVFFITTDGAGEYTAAFKYHGDNYSSIRSLDQEMDINSLMGTAADKSLAEDILEDECCSDEETCVVRNFNELCTMPYGTQNQEPTVNSERNDEAFVVHDLEPEGPLRMLPNINRIGCSAHLLDKLGKKDALLALDDEAYYEMHQNVFNKLKSIWNIKDSRLNSEIFQRITGRQIIGPHRIRWSKTFEAVSKFELLFL